MPVKPGEGRKLGRTSEHRIALLRNLATALFHYERIRTSRAKAKELERFANRLIARAKNNDLNARRYIYQQIHSPEVRKKIFDILVPRYQNRVGGYTQTFHIGLRKGDNTALSLIRLIA